MVQAAPNTRSWMETVDGSRAEAENQRAWRRRTPRRRPGSVAKALIAALALTRRACGCEAAAQPSSPSTIKSQSDNSSSLPLSPRAPTPVLAPPPLVPVLFQSPTPRGRAAPRVTTSPHSSGKKRHPQLPVSLLLLRLASAATSWGWNQTKRGRD